MSVFVAKGKEARRLNMNRSGCLNYEWLQLDDGEEMRVMFMTREEYFINYLVHNDKSQNITTHACLEPTGVSCPSCIRNIARRKQNIILFWDIDEEQIQAFNVPEKHLKTVTGIIKEYPTNYTNMVFKLKRIGKGKYTRYEISPIKELTPEEMTKADSRKAADIPDKNKLIKFKTPGEIEKMYSSVVH